MKTTNKAMTLVWMTALFLLASTAANAQTFQEPEQAVQAYITAVSTGSGAHIEQAFADNASIQYYDDAGEYQYYSRDEFAELVDTGNTWDATINMTNLLRTGKAANATVEFTWGENGERGYVDYLNLIYADGSWRITNKVAQYVSR
ncbi:MAG TPA: nuclear transport factor 2 family protein [Wenzhouxiangella sp.]|nr:nuclear transport factor 2 family protein [Wenzhouxiangella sp.]